jgi:hypothetical protein
VTTLSAFRSVRAVGAVLPADALARAVDLRMPGQNAEDYQLTPGMTVNAAVARAWEACLGAHRAWHAALDRLPPGDPSPSDGPPPSWRRSADPESSSPPSRGR